MEEETFDKKNYITFFVDEDGEDLKCKFNVTNIDNFLSIMVLILSGSATEDIIDLVFKEIDDEEIKSTFMSALLAHSSNNLNSEKQKPAISASEFSI